MPADAAKAAGLLFLVVVIQLSVIANVDVLTGHPNLLLVTIVCVSLLRGAIFGAVAGFSAGLLADTGVFGTLGFTALLLTLAGYWWLGVAAGFGFMLGELPNSFLKRQLGIPPGEAPKEGLARPFFLLADRLDSIVGLLTAVSLAVPTPAVTWGVVLVIGPGIHYAFSHLLFVVGVKARSA